MSEINLAAEAKIIKAAHGKVMASMRKSLEHAKECGEHLAIVKAGMSTKTFTGWLSELDLMSESTANNYIRIHQNWHEVQGEDNYTSALKALRKTRKPRADRPSPPVLTSWQQTIVSKMKELEISISVHKMEALLESFGVIQVPELAAAA